MGKSVEVGTAAKELSSDEGSIIQAHRHDDGANIVAHECGGDFTKSVGSRLS